MVALRVCRSRLLCVSLGLSANAVNPVFINRSEPFSFCVFPPSFESVYTSRKRQRSRKKKKWKNNQSKGDLDLFQWKSRLWMTWVRQTI